MKRFDAFKGFFGSSGAKEYLNGLLERGHMPHALLVTGEDGCGRNLFARMAAAAYLGDRNGLVERGIHPDCLVAEGEGASGNITARRVRELAYALNMAAVTADGKRVAILKNIGDLNKSSANALLKILEEPPAGVSLILTASGPWRVIETLRSRCVAVGLAPLPAAFCADRAAEMYPGYDRARIEELCRLYDGRLGFVKKVLEKPERLALADCAGRFCEAALKADKLAMMAEMECAAGSREDMKNMLSDAVMRFRWELRKNPAGAGAIEAAADGAARALRDVGRYVNMRLVAARLAAESQGYGETANTTGTEV